MGGGVCPQLNGVQTLNSRLPTTLHMDSDMTRVEYLFDMEAQSAKSRLLRPVKPYRLRRLYWWVRLKWLTVKWWWRNRRRSV